MKDEVQGRSSELTPAQMGIAKDMFAAWCGRAQFKQAFLDDCKRLATLTPLADSSEAGTGEPDYDAAIVAALRKACPAGGELGCSCAEANFQWFGYSCQHQFIELVKSACKKAPFDRDAALSAPVGEPFAYAWKEVIDPTGEVINGKTVTRFATHWSTPPANADVKKLYTHPPAPAVGADVREALGESSQTLEYLRREARTWGKIFSVNVDHVLDKNRKALSALTRPLGGFVQGSIATKQSTDPEGSSRTETAGANVRLFVECARCGGAGFSSPGTGYDNVCSECGGLRFIPFEAAGKRPVPSVSGNIHREQQRNTMGVTAGETAPNAVAGTDANAPGDTSLVSGASAEPNHQPHAVSQGWRDIETAPRDGTRILLYTNELDPPTIQAQWKSHHALYESGEWVDVWNNDPIETNSGPINPTYWMPLPAPPLPENTPRDSSESTTGGAAPDHTTMIIPCSRCSGEGSLYASRYGGNDPDVWRTGKCDACDGSGNEVCSSRGCDEPAVAFNDDGDALCADCLMEWTLGYAEDNEP